MSNQIPDLTEFNDSILKESTILYIEDDKEEQQAGIEVFKSVFKDVLVANDGLQGLELFTHNKDKINIILTDVNMPNMDGVAFMEEVRKSDWSIPILVTTETDNLNVIPKVIKLKVSNFIFKPILFKTTLKIMIEILEQINHLALLEKKQQEMSQFKDIIDSENLVSETDLTGKIIYANEMFSKVSGYSNEELIGQPHNIVRHPDVSPKIFENLWETIQSGKVWIGKVKNRAKTGAPYIVKATVFPIFDCNGEIIKYMSSRHLITDEEQEKQKLKKYIMSLRSEKIKVEQNFKGTLQVEIDKKITELNLKEFQKTEAMNKNIKDMQEEVNRMRMLKEQATKRVLSLEKELREKSEWADNLQKSYQSKIEKLHSTTKTAYEKYDLLQKKNDAFEGRYAKSQEGIKTLQAYVDEYRTKISNLEDVIKSLEFDKIKLQANQKS